MAEKVNYVIGTDTGGTFTDVTVVSNKGEIFIDKSPTTPGDFSIGVFDAVDKISQKMGLSTEELLRSTQLFKHGSTVGTNALITRRGSKVGLITTRGFEDTTLIMRGIGRVAGLSEHEIKHQAVVTKPEPLVPRRLICGVTERIDFAGDVIIPMNEEEARRAIERLVEEEEVEAIAVNFLFSFVNPKHEEQIAQWIREMYPNRDLYVSLSCRLTPVMREYARSNTVIINAFLGKTVESYIDRLSKGLEERGLVSQPLLMQANGGAAYREDLTPIGTVNSGPCGGMIASQYMARLLGHEHVITTDMGGTSFDVSLLVDGSWRYAREPVVERFHITWPMIDIQSIGAGGGTIAWIDRVTGRLRLGPQSAAADPGPVCYDMGGEEPTVTDADLVLGYLDPGYFLGGRMKLNMRRAAEAIERKIAKPLGLSLTAAAAGIRRIIDGHMSDLIRKQIVTTGHRPSEFVMYAFGGAGPVHAASYGAELGVSKIVVFPTSAVFSSFGVAAADLVQSHMQTCRMAMPADPGEINRLMKSAEERLTQVLQRAGVNREEISFRRTFYMRYRRQLNELDVPVPVKEYTAEDMESILSEFENRYEEVFGEGASYSAAGTELVSFRVDAMAAVVKPTLPQSWPKGTDLGEAVKGERKVFYNETSSFETTTIYDYAKLEPGHELTGPAIVETPITTIVIPPRCRAKVDGYRNLELQLKRD